MSNPTITVYQGSSPLASNDDWNQDNASEIRAVTESVNAFPLQEGSASAALVLNLNPGAYTVVMAGANGSTGVVLAEVYDADSAYTSRFVSLSTRGFVSTGDGILIQGIIVQGTGPRRVLVRGIGPGLTQYGVSNVLANPQMTVMRWNTATQAYDTVAYNDNWSTNSNAADIAAVGSQVGAFPLPSGSQDAALLLMLEPGMYTVLISGVGNGTGNALAEVYAVDPE
jgi:hypothetical protein